jgi:hypothetical protein
MVLFLERLSQHSPPSSASSAWIPPEGGSRLARLCKAASPPQPERQRGATQLGRSFTQQQQQQQQLNSNQDLPGTSLKRHTHNHSITFTVGVSDALNGPKIQAIVSVANAATVITPRGPIGGTLAFA